MPALERLRGTRVVAQAASVDRATWHGDDVTVLRFAPDDAFGLGARSVDIDDPHGIVEDEPGSPSLIAAIVTVVAERDHLGQRDAVAQPAGVVLLVEGGDEDARLVEGARVERSGEPDFEPARRQRRAEALKAKLTRMLAERFA